MSDKWDKCAFAKADSDADRVEIFFSERGSEFFLAEPAAGNPKVSEAIPAVSRYPGVDTIAGPSPIEGEALIDTVKGAFTVTVISMSWERVEKETIAVSILEGLLDSAGVQPTGDA